MLSATIISILQPLLNGESSLPTRRTYLRKQRRIWRIPEGDAFVREGQFTGWNPTLLLGGGVHGKTLGVIGMGRIGQAVASRAKGFNMPIYYYNRRRLTEEMERHLNARYMPLEHLLEQSDFVSLHAPYSKETHHLIDEAALRMMKSTAYLVNTSRGALIDEPALVRALQSGQIAGAGLDVFEREPELAEGLARLFNVVLAPHTGSATIETRNRMAELAVANVIAVLSGKPAITAVNSRMGC
jgi:glyoxylate reductase